MSSRIDWEMLIPRTLVQKLIEHGWVSCNSISLKTWDGPDVRLSRMLDLESVNLVSISKKGNLHSTLASQQLEQRKKKNRRRRSRSRSISPRVTRLIQKATSARRSKRKQPRASP